MNRFKRVTMLVWGLVILCVFFFACTKKAKLTSLVSTPTGTGPVISNVAAGTPASNSVTITWTTNENSTSQVFYGITKSFGAYTTESQVSSIAHSVTVTSLSAATTYYYYVKSKNAAGYSSMSGDDGSKSFVTAPASTSTTGMYLLFDDIKIEGTSGTPSTITIYDDDLSPTLFTGSDNGWNVAYMSADQPSNEAGWKLIFPDMNFYNSDDKQAGSYSWKITFDYTQKAWAGQFILSSGFWRANWTPAQRSVNLTGPTGSVKLKCYMKVSGVTSAKVKFGIGDDSGSKDSVNNGKVESLKQTVTTTWQQFELDLTGQDLSNINGVFLWSIAKTDVIP